MQCCSVCRLSIWGGFFNDRDKIVKSRSILPFGFIYCCLAFFLAVFLQFLAVCLVFCRISFVLPYFFSIGVSLYFLPFRFVFGCLSCLVCFLRLGYKQQKKRSGYCFRSFPLCYLDLILEIFFFCGVICRFILGYGKNS